jgi:hypothetical protein
MRHIAVRSPLSRGRADTTRPAQAQDRGNGHECVAEHSTWLLGHPQGADRPRAVTAWRTRRAGALRLASVGAGAVSFKRSLTSFA